MSRAPSIESLRVLEVCVRYASFTQAAAELNVTPAAVSARIRSLEAELGRSLFDRHGPRVTPTAAAVSIAAKVAEALQLIRSAVESCRPVSPRLRLTVVPSFATCWLAPRLPRFQALPDAPTIELDVSVELREPRLFDAAIRTGSGDWPSYDSTPLFPVQATPMLPPCLADRVKTPADLAALPLIPHPDWRRWFSEVDMGDVKIAPTEDGYPTHEMDAAAATAGAGVALLSPILFKALVRDGRLVRPFSHVLEGPAWHYLLTRRDEQRSFVLRFKKWIVAEAAAEASVSARSLEFAVPQV